MTIQEKIEEALTKDLAPTYLVVENESHLHIGHLGDDGSGNTHFNVKIASETFSGYNRITCHRMVYKSLNEYINNPIHALKIEIIT